MIPRGHPQAIDYTPREIKGWLYFVERHRKREDKHMLALHTAAARGDPKDIKKHLNKKDDE